ncbi:M20/M25/M40 family metallo-hydrolase [Cryobacterium sp. Y82]|uniref:M20/M25/M40 family metallo-hydrolase n=1 Tax=Cryobacterium sp. Y82 TaxID=2045017 RepID=UPI000CE47BB6|nr:M20/M25/M40 family metallo-hydrolase [Cryobacterium sp. Y82]
MTMDDVYAHIDSGFAAALDELACLVRTAGVSAQPTDDLAVCAQIVLNSVCTSGLRAHLIEGYGPPAVYGERVVDPGLPTVLIYGHYDVQPADFDARWHDDPFKSTIRAGRVFGRGTGELPVNVKVLIEGEDEIKSPHLAELVRDNRHLLAADLVITSESPVHRNGTPQLVLGTRGQRGVELRTRGANREAHPGSLGGLLPENFDLSRFTDEMRIFATILGIF